MPGITEKVFRQMIKELGNPKSKLNKKKLQEKILKYIKVYGKPTKGGWKYERPERRAALKARKKYLKGRKKK